MRIINQFLLITAVLILCLTNKVQSEQKKSEPNWPSIKFLLDKFSETNDKLNSSFIVKDEISIEAEAVTSKITGKLSKFEISESRFDGKRSNLRRQMWGNLSSPDRFIPKDKSAYLSHLWDGESRYKYSKGTDNLGLLIINKVNKVESPTDMGSKRSVSDTFMGFFPGDTERIDSVLRYADTISVRDNLEKVGQSKCYVIDATARGGKYTIWIVPEHGFNIAQVTAKKEENGLYISEKIGKGDLSFYSLRNVRFEKVNDLWIPMEGDIETIEKRFNGSYSTKQHYKRIEFIMNPDHNALGSFLPNDVVNGANVRLILTKGEFLPIKTLWQDGKVVDKDGKVIMDLTEKNQKDEGLLTYVDEKRHFRFQYPKEWKITSGLMTVSHYRDVFVALNNVGKENLFVEDRWVNPFLKNIFEVLPAGCVYLDIGWNDGPWGRWGRGITEMDSDNISDLLAKVPEIQTKDNKVTSRQLDFHKWGKRWSFTIYFRQPVREKDRADAIKILESFRFFGVPSDDDVWALGQARKYLPPEAEADLFFTDEGANELNYSRVERNGNEIYVTYTRVDPNNRELKRVWRYQVTNTGEVTRILTPDTETPKK